jgi:hypothetical protein
VAATIGLALRRSGGEVRHYRDSNGKDTDAVGEPAFRLVVTGTGPVLTLDDGTITCPLRVLAP